MDVFDNYKEFYWFIGGDWFNCDIFGYIIFGFGVSIFFVRYVVEVYFVMFVRVVFRYMYGSVMVDYKNIIIMVLNDII